MPRFVAPGRVNLLGDHTDYNLGYVLPLAIDRACSVSATPDGSDLVRARSAQLPGTVAVTVDGSTDPRTVEPSWGRFAAGVVLALTRQGITIPGVHLMIDSTVPPGSGLSSSSALSVALTLALADAADAALGRLELARLALAAEVAATGVPGGLMDQLASLYGRAGHALLVDCRTNAVTPVPISPRIAVLVVHSGVPRTLAGTAYAAAPRRVRSRRGAPRHRITPRRVTRAGRRRPPRAPRRVRERARAGHRRCAPCR